MNECPDFTHLLVLPHRRIQNANAVSSALTHGFPSMTAFLGHMWALERKTRAAGLDLAFNAVGVVCHDHQEQTTEERFVRKFRLTRNPVDKDGDTAAIVEEGRIHLDVSLIFAVRSERWSADSQSQADDIQQVADIVSSMRLAGGTLIPPAQSWRRAYQPYTVTLIGNEEDQRAIFRKARLRLLPGFTLVGRDDLLEKRFVDLQAEKADASRLDAWLSLARINWRYQSPNDASKQQKSEWANDRTGGGWIVPIPVGYGALSDLHRPGSVANARDGSTPFRFVESLYSVGEWISPHRLQTAQELLWYADSKPDEGLYRCRNDYRHSVSYDFD